MKINKLLFLILGLSFLMQTNNSYPNDTEVNKVYVVGAMKDVMWEGEIQGKINLDDIKNKSNLYGLGPVENLSGELLIIDGISYKSTVLNKKEMKVVKNFQEKAPFFVYSNLKNWKEINLPKDIKNLKDLEAYLDKISKNYNEPFTFKLQGKIKSSTIHIMNLPKDTEVYSPDDAHIGQVKYQIDNQNSDIVGFFSRKHKGIFTHHDTFLHLHLITSDRLKMGHLEQVNFGDNKIKLYIPSYL